MKTKIFIIIIFVSFFNESYSQWNWNSPKPTGNIINSIKFINDNTGWMAGRCGTVIKTTNGGVNWQTQNTNSTKDLNSIFFIDNNTGFVCGEYNSLIKTTNGGNNWLISFDSSSVIWYSVYFSDNNNGYLAGNSGLMKTTNCGINWEISPTNSGWFKNVYFNLNTGWVSGLNGRILHTTNGGNNWESQNSSVNYDLCSSSFINQSTGWIIGNILPLSNSPTNTIIKTTNGGTNWYSLLFQPGFAISDICFINQYTGYSCGYKNTNGTFDSLFAIFQKTTDGGNNWITYNISDKSIMNSIYISGNTIWSSGYNIFKSTNSGDNWSRITEGFYKSIMSVSVFPSDNITNVAGIFGFFARSTNGGNNWAEYPVSNSEYISYMNFRNINTGWAPGYGGVYRTTNSGLNWSFYEIQNEQLIRTSFINDNTGWVTSYFPNSVYKTTNSGLNWFNLPSISASLAWGINFLNENTGFVGDAYGSIYKTTNGGGNWVTYNTGTSNWIADFSFLDDQTGYAVGELHSIFKTTNTGDSWEQIYTRSSGSFYDVEFIKNGSNLPNIGYAVGTHQALYRTSNGGNSWYPMVSPTTNNLNEVKFINNFTGYIVGDLGTVLYTTNGGSTFVTNSSNNLPERYSLHQNYPNPFNNSTVISFDVKKNTSVKIVIYDVTGKEMETLVNDYYQAGSYKITSWFGNYTSGIYFYKLITDGYSETKRMVLVK